MKDWGGEDTPTRNRFRQGSCSAFQRIHARRMADGGADELNSAGAISNCPPSLHSSRAAVMAGGGRCRTSTQGREEGK